MPTIPSMGGISGVGGIGPTQPGGDWSIGALDGTPTTGATSGGGSFASALGDQLSALEKTQNSAADASRSLADGTATDPTQAIVSVERAQLSMQLASQLRTKGVEALQDLFHTQV
ncbi:flagellar hook-basal body complex protein FliE [Baekduia sp.]|jgi:flagellar hook-basal body complex protein FliE|uniref:flagellar hook-basal body complex protein FliE n=1 Tax=Baekduia sp. TaxID=2600305 RepID=UPI002E066104|nr:flagellar hook-basal body complex protein FliE [Baekduia sp.]